MTPPTMQQPPIAILGAGPSGLMLGRLLEKANIQYIIFERDADSSIVNQGGTLDIHAGSGQLALEEAGLLDQFKQHARFDARTKLTDKHGKVYLDFAQEAERPEIDRKILRKILLDSIPEGRVRWGSKVQRVEKGEDGEMAIHFDDGNVEEGFKLVVGADGAWSKARSLVTSARPVYSGQCYLSTSIKPESPVYSTVQSFAGHGGYMTMGDEKMIVAQYIGDGSYQIGLGLSLPETWKSDHPELLKNDEAMKEWLLQDQFAGWPAMHTDLIRHSSGDFHVWPLFAMPPESLSWGTMPGVALVGDAAHVTTPFQGEGVNCAMHDSVQLVQEIKKYGLDNIDQAVAEYEKLMLPRGADLISRSLESGKYLFAPDAPVSWMMKFVGTVDLQQVQ